MPWFATIPLATLKEKRVIPVEVDGLRLALFDLEDGVYATSNVCTHQFALLTDGFVENGCVECPLHQGLFDIRTGKAQGSPVTKDITTYPVKIENGIVHVDVTPNAPHGIAAPPAMKAGRAYGRLVVIGAGQAGAQVASTAREHGFAGWITIIGDEAELPYERPPLSKDFLLGKCTLEDARVFKAVDQQKLDIDLRTGVAATGIDRAVRRVTLSTGEAIEYDTLVIATGARPRTLAILGAEREGVHLLRTGDDAAALSAGLCAASRVVVIGGGFIGMEIASSARTLGKDVTVLESQSRLMTRVLPEPAAAHLAGIARSAGVEIKTGVGVARIDGDENGVTAVVLTDGAVLPADVVIIGVGAIPNTELAIASGLTVESGIVVDHEGRTSDPLIFAVGDAASRRDPATGALLRLESWQNAKNSAIKVGRLIAGTSGGADEVPWFWSDQFGRSIQIVGILGSNDETVVRPSAHGPSFFCIAPDGKLAGAVTFGDAAALRLARELLESGTRDARNALAHGSHEMTLPRSPANAIRNSKMEHAASLEQRYVWPNTGLTTIPDWVYTSEEIYKREVERIFHGRTWNFVGLEAELPNAGDYMRSSVGPTPVVVTRAEDGSINVFENRCAHRAAEFCRELRGNAAEIVCPYHQWSYDMKGNLKGVPFRRGVAGQGGMGKDFSPEEHGLRKLFVTTRNGVIFASYQAEMESIEDYLGEEMLKDFDAVFNGRKLKILGYYRHTLLGNWKLYPENLKDPYHATLLHTFLVTFGLLVAGNKSAMIVDPRGRHSTMASAKSDSGNVADENKKEMRAYREGMTLQDPRLMDFIPEFESPWSVTMQVIWPNLIVQREMNTLGVRHIIPKGPNDFIMTWTMFGYEGDDDETTRHRLRQGNLMGPAGFLGVEDNEAIKFVQDGMLNATPDRHYVALDPAVEAGSSDTLISEAAIRAMYQHWRQEMGL
ncbi:FAD-dependent oxidoreductase [Dongia sp.]|uniref:FAD-dependent oxidoreductase n=1 Tax=Dongia sp. TaxID=1977262 RepID=UPI0037535B28